MKKIIFANQLRAVAAILVMIAHWIGVFWGAREIVAIHTMSPVTAGDNSFLFDLISNRYLIFGSLGVSIFFLISGFVIPIALEKNTAYKFIVARAFRIFPTYIIGLSFSLLIVWISSIFWGKHFVWSGADIISNLFLIHTALGLPSIDLVNWTLIIEVLFYILSALLMSAIRKGDMKPILLFSFISVLINLNQNHFCQMIGVNFMYLNYILIGTIFYFAFQSRISHTALIFYVVIEMIFLVLSWKFSALKNQFPIVTCNYFLGLIIFSLSYYYRNKFKPLTALDWFADISFPIYIIHSLVGYSIIKLLMAFNYSFLLALLTTFPVVILIAYVLHIFIEVPSTKYGKELLGK